MNIDRGKESFTEEEIALVRQQLWDHKTTESLSWTDLERLIGEVAGTTLSAFANGTYNGDNQKVAWKVNRFFVADETRRAQTLVMPITPGFRQTRTARQMTAQLRWAHEGEMAAVVGDPGLGKTATFDQYCAITPNAFKATMTPATRAVGPMLAELARVSGRMVAKSANANALFQELVIRLTDIRALLIIDEVQHLSDVALDQVRAIHDRTGCGVVLGGNRTVLTRIQAGARHIELAQIYSRVSWPQTYLKPFPEDVEILCDAWDVPRGNQREFLAKVASLPGALRSLTQTLKMATLAARSTDEERTLGHLKTAWTQLSRQSLAA
ncbi:AAA family ATPase [Rhizobium sp. CRIBSB]|nr:AAA family ATPase [Rhizobium sp. CRIBSB]